MIAASINPLTAIRLRSAGRSGLDAVVSQVRRLIASLASPSLLAEFAVASDEAPDHCRNDPFGRKRRRQAREFGVNLRIVADLADELARELDRQLDRLILGDRSQSELGHRSPPPSGSKMRRSEERRLGKECVSPC